MLCNICTKNQATVHLTEIVDDQMSELHLCDDCARKKSMQMEQQFGLSDLLAGLVDYGKQLSSVDKEAAAVMHCSACGLTYEDFRKIGRLGCGECYTAFAKYLSPLLKRIHGASQHVGKAPKGLSGAVYPKAPTTKAADVNELKASLQRAIESEDFEEAALLRDAIREAEARMKEPQNNKEPEKKKRAKQ
jgi:protein arginine kinase activator